MAESRRAGFRVRPYPAALLLLTIVLASLLPARADTGQAAIEAGKLKRIQTEISTLKQELDTVRDRHTTEYRSLEQTDREIGRTSSALRSTERELQQTREQLAVLETRRDKQRASLDQMRTALVRELRASYRGAGEQRIRVLLSQDDPAILGRMLAYQGYLTRARNDRMNEYRSVLAELRDSERQLREQQARYETLHGEQQQGVTQLRAQQAHQQDIVAGLQQQLDKGNERLQSLEADRKRVNQLLESLRKMFADVPYVNGPNKPLRQLKGQLGWPVAGRISMSYGSRQAGGKMSARGVHIDCPAGADVHAIARGRVAFADWLRGFGLLTIIDHGDGYMSLYGENSSLYKSVGEWVERGDVISATGNSGGQPRTGLYLELRKDGQPINPARWFRGKPPALKRADGQAAAG